MLNNQCVRMKLEDVAESISAGGTPRRDVKEYWVNGDIPWLKISDLKSTYVDESEEKITKEGLQNSSAKLFSEGTVLFSIFATLGATAILSRTSATNQAIAGIVPKKEIIDTKFLYYLLKAEKNKITAKKTHATQDNINLTILRKHEISVPPLDTQLKIVSILEKADQLREWREQSDKLTKELLTNIFLKMFGDPIVNTKNWMTIPLEDLSKRKITYGIVQPGNEVPNGVPIVRSIDLKDDFLSVTGLKRISSDIDTKYFRSRLKGGELLISVRGKIGPVAIAEQGLANSNVSRGVALLEPTDNVKVEYLFGLFTIPSFRNRLDQNARGIALRQLNLNILRAIEIPVPPLKLQEKFGNLFNEIRKARKNQDDVKAQIQFFYEKIVKNNLTEI